MGKRYTKKTQRSRRKSPGRMRGRIVSRDQASVQLQLSIAEILAGMPDTVEALAAEAGLLVMKALIDDEVERRVGPRYAHATDRTAVRWGCDDGHVVFAGRKVAFQRPRVRGQDGREVELERYRLFQSHGRMQESVSPRVLAGVSTRDYRETIDAVCDGYGIDKSSVSRHWKAASLAELSVSASRSLEEALEETLTLHRLGVPESLRRTLRSTHPIESCFSTTRKLCHNVKRWRTDELTQRWAATMLQEAERRCRRVKGYRELPLVIGAVRGIETQQAAA